MEVDAETANNQLRTSNGRSVRHRSALKQSPDIQTEQKLPDENNTFHGEECNNTRPRPTGVGEIIEQRYLSGTDFGYLLGIGAEHVNEYATKWRGLLIIMLTVS